MEKLNLVPHLRGVHKFGTITLTHEGELLLINWLLENKLKDLSEKDKLFCQLCKSAKKFNRKQKVVVWGFINKYVKKEEMVLPKLEFKEKGM